MTREQVIGSGENLPWHLPDDLLIFKRLTMGCTLLMGRKTHTSIGRPLPGRHNIVLSRSLDKLSGVHVCGNFIEGLTTAAQFGRPVFVIGGEELYRKALPIATELHISWVKQTISGDVYFPEFELAEWEAKEEENYQEFQYVYYRRKDKKKPTISGRL